MKRNLYFIILIFAIYSLVSCNDDEINSETHKINQFVLENMDLYYYWYKTMPQLDYSSEQNTFDLFDKLLVASYDEELERNIDQWSFITDDYQGLLDYFAGVRKTMGHSIRPFYVSENSNEVVGFIEYVEPNSPAAEALERGDMIYKIDGQTLTDENYYSLIYQDSYTMTLGTFNADFSISPLSPEISLTAVEINSNPIHTHKVIEHADKKIGYLMYTSFINDYDDDLQAVFADFKTQGVSDLVLDLRYNGGGSVNTAILLGSMIAPSSAVGDIYIQSSYNDKLNAYFKDKYPNDKDLFIDRIEDNTNNLNLNRLVVLTTGNTASASEMIIYGLSPHMEVYQIGEQTHGKYYASITIDDEKKHNWAIQPIVLRTGNKDNSIDYRQGLIPDKKRVDFLDASGYYPLGDPNEDFLALALEYLTEVKPTGAALKSTKKPMIPTNIKSKPKHPLDYNMYRDLN